MPDITFSYVANYANWLPKGQYVAKRLPKRQFARVSLISCRSMPFLKYSPERQKALK